MSITFTKLFSSITASTVWCEDPETKIVWITMLAMADKNGRVWGSVPGIAGIARVSVEGCRAAINKFLGPDPDSRTKDNEGRRISEIDGGWRLLNYEKYRSLRDEEERKEYKREWIAEKRAKDKIVDKNVDSVYKSRPQYTNAEAEAEAEAEIRTKKKIGAPKRAQPQEAEGFAAIRQAYPRRGGGQRWGDAEAGYRKAIANGVSPGSILAGVERYALHIRGQGKEGTEYVQQAGTFLGRNAGWQESWEPVKQKKELSAVEKVKLANEAQNERVVRTQSNQGFEDLDLIGSDVRQSSGTGLRRIGS